LQKYYKGTQHFWELPEPEITTTFFSGCDFVMGVGKPKLCTRFKVAAGIFNIKEKAPKFGDLPQLEATPTFLVVGSDDGLW